jgi:Mce-associated membrane protein
MAGDTDEPTAPAPLPVPLPASPDAAPSAAAPADAAPSAAAPSDAGPSDAGPSDIAEVRPVWWAPVAIGLCVAAVVLAVAGALGTYRVIAGIAADQGRSSALTAGRSTAVSLLSFHYETAEQDLAKLRQLTTPDFANGFVRNNNAFLQIISQGKVNMTSEATAAGMRSYQSDAAHVLVSVKAKLSNAQQPQSMERDYRMDISLVRRDGHWLANGIQFIS